VNVDGIRELLGAVCLTGSTDMDVSRVCACDLLSDVLRFSPGSGMLLTGLANVHTVRTADVSGIGVVTFVRGKMPGRDVLEEAEKCSITLLKTDKGMFESCGILYDNGLSGHVGWA
jgi:hypothetical protein